LRTDQALLPERAPWLADLEAELFVFPAAATTTNAIPSAKRFSITTIHS